ncbi:hypothetical protein MSG28_014242 [Choristoneura fumiferana]|uniref:Uncharacterized protein n=1 Tax=Choristoneura fumiferana TaxID=7141 RepID=A0ACC0JGD1_CHOFU|nr:hypothetical protein MSG28_014242 [Choristoneura fumiferana]
MMPYPSGLILDNSNNYGIVKTETVFGFVPPNHTFVNENINDTEPVEWVFKPGSFERRSLQARGKIKKYAPLLTGIGVKVIAVLGLLFGGLTLLVTKALVVAKLAFLAAAALGIQKLLSGGGLNNISGKIASFQSPSPQWNSPTAPASSYPYARSSNVAQDGNDLAYKSQIPS